MTPCPLGSFCDVDNMSAATACTAGSFCNATLLTAPAGVCDAGSACPTGAAAMAPCSAGFFCLAGAPFAFGAAQNFLFTEFYASFSVTDSSLSSPAIGGPPGRGWLTAAGSPLIGTPGNYNPIVWSNGDSRAGGTANFQTVSEGFIYSLNATTIMFQVSADDGFAVYLGGVAVVSRWFCCSSPFTSSSVSLSAGFTSFIVRYFNSWGSGNLNFAYQLGGVGGFQTDGTGVFFSSSQRWYVGVLIV
jgi:hypothetical protein